MADLGAIIDRLSDLRGDVDLITTPPAADDALVFDGTKWVPGAGGGGGDFLPLAGGTLTGEVIGPSFRVGNQGSVKLPEALLNIDHKFTDAGAPIHGFYGSPAWEAPGDTGATFEAIRWNPYLEGAANYSGLFNATDWIAEHFGSGTLAQMRAVRAQAVTTGTGVVAQMRVFSATSVGSNFTDFHAFHAENLAGANRAGLTVASGLSGAGNNVGVLLGTGTIPTGNFGLHSTLTYPSVLAGALHLGSVAAPDAAALLELTSTTQGLLFPRMTEVQRDAITAIAGLVVYNTDADALEVYDGTAWVTLGAGGGGGDLTDAVILAPGADTRNVIQPSGDFIPFVLKGAAGAAQTKHLIEYQLHTGAVMSYVTFEGRLGFAGSAEPSGSNYISLAEGYRIGWNNNPAIGASTALGLFFLSPFGDIIQFLDDGSGTLLYLGTDAAVRSMGLRTTSFGGGIGVFGIADALVTPSTDPAGGGIIYCESGKLMYRGSSGTVTELAPA